MKVWIWGNIMKKVALQRSNSTLNVTVWYSTGAFWVNCFWQKTHIRDCWISEFPPHYSWSSYSAQKVVLFSSHSCVDSFRTNQKENVTGLMTSDPFFRPVRTCRTIVRINICVSIYIILWSNSRIVHNGWELTLLTTIAYAYSPLCGDSHIWIFNNNIIMMCYIITHHVQSAR